MWHGRATKRRACLNSIAHLAAAEQEAKSTWHKASLGFFARKHDTRLEGLLLPPGSLARPHTNLQRQLVSTKWHLETPHSHRPRQDFRARSTFRAKGVMSTATQVAGSSTRGLQTLDDLLLSPHRPLHFQSNHHAMHSGRCPVRDAGIHANGEVVLEVALLSNATAGTLALGSFSGSPISTVACEIHMSGLNHCRCNIDLAGRRQSRAPSHRDNVTSRSLGVNSILFRLFLKLPARQSH